MVLSRAALKGIAAYEYHPGALTWLDTKFNLYWNAIVNVLPAWLAPNVITLVGTAITVSTSLAFFQSVPSMTETAPFHMYLLCAIGLFLYQTCDAVDGKQARRTGSSSPLGQLLDHGGDAICNVFSNLAVGVAIGTGPTSGLLLLLSSTSVVFFLAQWEEYHTGTLRCGNGYVGVTEGLLLLMALHIVTAFLGHVFWDARITSTLSVRDGLLLLVAVAMTLQGVDNIQMVCAAMDKKTPRGSKTQALLQLMPTASIVLGSIVWMLHDDVAAYGYPFFLAIGLSHAMLSSRMIVCHMCKIPFAGHADVVCLLGAALAALVSTSRVHGAFIATVYLSVVVVVHGCYMACVVREIGAYLGIALWRIKTKN
ncbi:hypothetical protein SPRG_19575 [Saprolegnia parasitica CBS 223.65]|uniref:CDP-alcohol phosphatidyltransferase n=1 Tax=Saprolegnia parasitica (strain CBS 223.65) TaxID=695850 RepID=A0A067CW68_SAPPC|nr:hypothetical protein SPRG_19575 [Saprolegnia parasitica CBS 223.65]KDO31047.1 hypothetical protein SPRG_19575 [Saprolegnia parasitica CBS 223.65]|eukprot:XP_012198308.1 hypothetical protein SPRG_19575 [Saprolegnia parasitica CBS 223.65]